MPQQKQELRKCWKRDMQAPHGLMQLIIPRRLGDCQSSATG